MPGTTHARPRSPSRSATTCWRTRGRCCATSSASTSGRMRTSVVARSGPARSPRRPSGSIPAPPRQRTRVPARVRQLDRRGVRSRLRPGVPGRRHDLRDASVAPRGRSRSVDGPGARMGGARRGLHDRVEHDAAEAEPRYRRARARRRPRGSPGGSSRVTSVLQGLPLGYHRDLQEDKEPVFDAADTLELVLSGAGRRRRLDPVRRPAMRAVRRATKGSTPPTSPRRWCAAACRSARRIGERASC